MNVSAWFAVPWISRSMNPWLTRVAPGPGEDRVNAWFCQKMLLKNATGFEKCGAVAGSVAWNSGSLASDASPAECGVSLEVTDDPVETLLATVLLMNATLELSSSFTAPPRS